MNKDEEAIRDQPTAGIRERNHPMAAPVLRYVGIDVSKAHLDVARLPEATGFRVTNDATGWAALLARLPGDEPVTIVLEATGAYHRGVTAVLTAAGPPPAVINPERTHAFIVSEGVRAKTDQTDARLLARCGQQKQPAPSPIEPDTARDLKELVACRDDLTKLLTMEKNRLHVASARTAPVHPAVLETLTAQIRGLDAEIAAVLAAVEKLATRTRIRRSVPGVGPVLSAGPIASLAGVAPHPRDSGTRHGTRAIRGGRVTLRTALSPMAVTATRCNPVIRDHYARLRGRRPHKVALIGCARWLLTIMPAMLREDITCQDTKVGQGQFLPQPA